MRTVIALAGICVGLAWLGLGLWLVWLGADEESLTRTYVGLLLCAIGIPVYGIGSEMVGRLRGRSGAEEGLARPEGGAKVLLLVLGMSVSFVAGGALAFLLCAGGS